MAATIIGACDSPELPSFAAGPGRTIIVMPDCIPNPDPASLKVCTNYDLTWD